MGQNKINLKIILTIFAGAILILGGYTAYGHFLPKDEELILQKYLDKRNIFEDQPQAVIESKSPNNKNIIIDEGTSPTRNKTIVDLVSGQELFSFFTNLKAYSWIDNDQIIFTDLQKVNTERPFGDGTGSGIAIINTNGQKTILAQATDNMDYNFMKLADGKIYYSITKVENQDDWLNEKKQNITYWSIDLNGKNLKQEKQ